MLILGVSARVDVGGELLEGRDALALEPFVLAAEVAVHLGVTRLVAGGVASTSTENRYWASHPVPAPIENSTSDVRFEISAAIRAGTTSISAAKAPAASSVLTWRYT